jgi:hypothetical protein
MVRNERGQAVVEYILLVAIIVTFFVGVRRAFERFRIGEALMRPITQEFAAAYQFGHPKAKGFDNGGPEYHPRAIGGNNNFRIFFNPGR